MWDALVDTTTGRGELRLILQPLVAVLFGLRLGMADVRSPPAHELRSALVTLVIAVVIDAYMQILAHGQVRWFSAFFVGTALIYVPFELARHYWRVIAMRKRSSGEIR